MPPFIIRLFAKPVKVFYSPQGLYKIEFPEGWKKVYSFRKSSVNSFFNKEYKGILQISAVFHANPDYRYSANNEFETVKETHPTAILYNKSGKQVISLSTDDKCESTVVFNFIFGEKNVKLLVTYTYGYKEFNLEEVNSEYNRVSTLLDNLEFL
jgi:hypothetical protein